MLTDSGYLETLLHNVARMLVLGKLDDIEADNIYYLLLMFSAPMVKHVLNHVVTIDVLGQVCDALQYLIDNLLQLPLCCDGKVAEPRENHDKSRQATAWDFLRT